MVTMTAKIILMRWSAQTVLPDVSMLSFNVTMVVVSIIVGSAMEKMIAKMAQTRKDAVSVKYLVCNEKQLYM